MDQSDLQSASTYINNLLLARGLLRDGKSVDFARLAAPSTASSKSRRREEEGEAARVTAQVMNLVHDLVLKRDRDQSQQESVAQTLLTLRAETTSTTTTITRLTSANADLRRQLDAEKSATRTARSVARTAEASARALRDEVARVKTLLAQVRTQCANDVRKRDVELARLKAHLSIQQRGSASKNGGMLVGPSCSIISGTSSRGSGSSAKEEEQQLSVQDAEYNLRQETTEFLTQLSQSLSDENDALLELLRGTLVTLKELQGMSLHGIGQGSRRGEEQPGDGSVSDINGNTGDDMVQVLAVSYDTLAADLDVVLGNLRDLLTSPSFAPIEEVQVREEEIQRLREGWEKMEGRWREAAVMMQGWRERMLSGGDTVNLDELKMGLNLGEGLESYNSSGQPDINDEGSEEFAERSEVQPSYPNESTVDDSLIERPLSKSQEKDSPETNSSISHDQRSHTSLETDSAPPPALTEGTGNTETVPHRPTTIRKTVSFQQENTMSPSPSTSFPTDADVESEDELTRQTVDLNLLDIHKPQNYLSSSPVI